MSRLLLEKANIEVNKLLNWFCPQRYCPLIPRRPKLSNQRLNFSFSGLNLVINEISLKIIGTGLKEESIKFIDVIFDESATWKHDIIHINKIISKSLFAIHLSK